MTRWRCYLKATIDNYFYNVSSVLNNSYAHTGACYDMISQ